ncbi:MAG: hypothetical protein JWN70_6596 [Planctomycetaceae bacterium]|nr:hypothetical protein [Planctomycetaceae bacterium]
MDLDTSEFYESADFIYCLATIGVPLIALLSQSGELGSIALLSWGAVLGLALFPKFYRSFPSDVEDPNITFRP